MDKRVLEKVQRRATTLVPTASHHSIKTASPGVDSIAPWSRLVDKSLMVPIVEIVELCRCYGEITALAVTGC